MRPSLLLLAVLAAGCLSVDGPWAVASDPWTALYGPGTARIRIVVHAQPGHEPGDLTVAGITEEIGALTGKPVDVEVRPQEFGVAADHSWTREEVAVWDERVLAEPWPDGVALAHVLALPGCAYFDATRDCMAGYAGRLAHVWMHASEGDPAGLNQVGPNRDTPWLGWAVTQRYLYVHELGHVFGFVRPLGADRLAEGSCRCHSTESGSVMYYQRQGIVLDVDGGAEGILETLERQELLAHYQFSELDLADAKAFRDGLAH